MMNEDLVTRGGVAYFVMCGLQAVTLSVLQLLLSSRFSLYVL